MWADLRRALAPREVGIVEANAFALGATIPGLMDRAGEAVADEVRHRAANGSRRIAIVAGSGNNGGDGLAAAHFLLGADWQPAVFLIRPPETIRTEAARAAFERVAGRCPVSVGVPAPATLSGFDLVVDAVLGVGQSAPLRPPASDAVAAMRESGAPVLSIDVPTGASDPHGLRPKWTVTFTASKSELGPGAGEVVVRDIGIPPEAWQRTGPGEFLAFPTPSPERGRSGRMFVIGGGPYAGAPALAALAGLRSGAERATLIVPDRIAGRVQSFSPDLVVLGVGKSEFGPGDLPEIRALLETAHPSSVVIGMGLGQAPATREMTKQLLGSLAGTLALVVDADALPAVAERPEALAATAAPMVLTPNRGEFARWFGAPARGDPAGRRAAALAAAGRLGAVLLSKGDTDLIADGGAWAENAVHHPAMTVGGVGDVLGGVVGSLLAQGLSGFVAARLATLWVGEAGQRAAGRRGFGLTASDVVEELPETLVAGLTRVRHLGGSAHA